MTCSSRVGQMSQRLKVGSSAVVAEELKKGELSNVAERIIQSINSAFDKDDSMDEFDITPQESKSNRSPVMHVTQKLAVASWCVPIIYVHSFRNFLAITRRNSKNWKNQVTQASTVTIADKRDNFNSVGNEGLGGQMKFNAGHLSEVDRMKRGLVLSRVLVLLNPDLTMAWNFRREAFKQGYTKLKEEMNLILLTASRKPKCPEGFSYRRWLIQEYLTNEDFNGDESLELFQSEAKAAETAAAKYFSNYHSWNYRHFILELFLGSEKVTKDHKDSILTNEKELSDAWLKFHVSDHSGLHYRQRLFKFMVASKGRYSEEAIKVCTDELDENRELILYYPGHECLWYHRRAILKCLNDNIESSSETHSEESSVRDILANVKEKEAKLIDAKIESQGKGQDTLPETEIKKSNTGKVSNLDSVSQEYASLNNLYYGRHAKWLKHNLI